LGEIVEITIPSSDYNPVFAFGQAWERVGKSNIKLSAQKLRELVLRFEQKPFDTQAFDEANVAYDLTWINKLQLRTNNTTITQKELQEQTGISRRGIEYNIKLLKERGMLIRQGAAKGGYWQIINRLKNLK
jgi:predicted HTH transcriptional regulator